MTRTTLILIAAALSTVWAVANAGFVIAWNLADDWKAMPDAWPELSFDIFIKVWATFAAYELAIGLLYYLWAISPAGKSQSPSGL